MAKKREKEGEREPKVRLSMRGQEERREGGREFSVLLLEPYKSFLT